MASPATSRTRLPREDRMEQTLEVARTLFAERGYAAVTMDEVAAAVGVTKPLLYNYFGNKERLYIACMERAGDALLDDDRRRGRRGRQSRATRWRRRPAPSSPSSTPTAPPGRCSSTRPCPRRRDRRAGRRLPRQDPRPRRRLAHGAGAAERARRPPSRGRGALRPPCSAPPRRSPAGGCAPGAIPAAEAAELLIATVEPGLGCAGSRRPQAASQPKPKRQPQ